MDQKDATNYVADTLQRRALNEIDDAEARECFRWIREQVGDAAYTLAKFAAIANESRTLAVHGSSAGELA